MQKKTQSGTRISTLLMLCMLIFLTVPQEASSQCDTILALDCESAPLVPLENYCGRTNSVSHFCCPGFCGTNTVGHNPTYHKFIAKDSSILIEIEVLPCDAGYGMQAAIISGCPWDNDDVLSCNPNAPDGTTFTLQSNEVIPGGTYWLLIDGSNGSMCNFLITNVEGIVQPGTPVISLQSSGTTLTAIPEGNFTYDYAWFDCVENEVLGTGPVFEAPGSGCYCVKVRDTVHASTFCTTVTATSNEDAEADLEISIYPNPSSSVVEIVASDPKRDNLTLKIFDYQGRIINESRITDGKYRHIWKDEAGGIYLFMIVSDQQVVTMQHILYTGR
jgi:hypothetical protein